MGLLQHPRSASGIRAGASARSWLWRASLPVPQLLLRLGELGRRALGFPPLVARFRREVVGCARRLLRGALRLARFPREPPRLRAQLLHPLTRRRRELVARAARPRLHRLERPEADRL